MFGMMKYLKKKEWLMVVIALALVVLQVWIDLKLPEFTTNITSMYYKGTVTVKKVLIQGIYLSVCAISSAGLSMITGLFAALIGSGLSKTLREKIFVKVQGYSMGEIKKFSTASLITRTTNDVRNVQSIIAMCLIVVVKAPILATWGILKLVNKSWQVSVATFVCVFIISLCLVIIMMFAIPRFKKIQTLYDNLNRVTRENLTGVKVVRAFNAEEYQKNKFSVANQDVYTNDLQIHKAMGFLGPVMSFMLSGLTVASYTIIALMINKADLFQKFVILGDIWLYTSWSMQIIGAFMLIIFACMMFPRFLVSVKRINEVLNTENSLKEGLGVETDLVGEIEFKNVSFKYPDSEEDSLKGISFKCHKGDTVAIIGATGSGKSSLINLIPRFYDVTDGEVLVDGKNVKDYKFDELHNKIGYISQKAVLLKGKIKDNISLGLKDGQKPNQEEIDRAIEIAQASDFVKNLEEGTDYQISQGGANVSGGQKQRLSIARAISRKPEILIFDDSFSALDFKTDKNLRATLKKEMKGTTCIIVAQRIGTIKNADLILVLDDGKIVGEGKHEELLKTCKEYKEIADSQFNKEEQDG